VVAAATDGEFGTGRTAEIQAGESGSESRVFKNLDEAIAWVSDRS
jgi:hypothetical protein